MDSPLNVGDTTTNSIQHLLSDTHLGTSCSMTVNSAVYSDEKVIQLNLYIQGNEGQDGQAKVGDPIVLLRRVQDSYVNISQLLSILVRIGHFSEKQLDNFLKNEILTSTQYLAGGSSAPRFNDLRGHRDRNLRGLWIPYDKAVSLALKFDIYELAKKLFLIDVHDYDDLPTLSSNKRPLVDDFSEKGQDTSLTGSPSKKQKLPSDRTDGQSDSQSILRKAVLENRHAPYTLPPLVPDNEVSDLISDIKLKFGEIFKKDEGSELLYSDIQSSFQAVLQNKQESLRGLTDIPLDQQGKTALHFASTLASLDLVSAFIKLGLCSPIRGTNSGKSPLISAISVTNSMERGNFAELLSSWLWPNLWLYDSNDWSFLHYLAYQSNKNIEASKLYMSKILEWVISSEQGKKQNSLETLSTTVINLQDKENGNTCLHLAAENESRWFINIFLELNADVNIANNTGVKAADFDIVKDVIAERKHNTPPYNDAHQDSYIFELLNTSMGLLHKKQELGVNPESDDEENDVNEEKLKSNKVYSTSSSNRIFQSIQDLLANTNLEYDNIIKTKKSQIKSLNQALHDSTIVTANNRFVSNKISEKLAYLDNLKLQMTNISEKLQLAQKEIPADLKVENEDENTKFDSDEPFIIKPIYEKLKENGNTEDIKPTEEVLSQLPPLPILKARIKAYQEINSKIESDLANLSDYSELTSKFKKVVSFCTGVDINEVDELLDGLLEAVEGQQ